MLSQIEPINIYENKKVFNSFKKYDNISYPLVRRIRNKYNANLNISNNNENSDNDSTTTNPKNEALKKVSPAKGWKRCYKKYAANKDQHLLSPVKQICCTLKSVQFPNDIRIDGFIWILSMSEQFYYNNIINISINFVDKIENLKNILIQNIHPYGLTDIKNNLENIFSIGKGTFGEVIKATDKFTQEEIAIKVLIKKGGIPSFEKNTHAVLQYLHERYYLMQAYNSPFIMQFKSSFVVKKINGLFLTFEYCPWSLDKYIAYLKSIISFDCGDNFLAHENTLTGLNKKFNKKSDLDIYNITVVMVFELFCMLEFLGKCHLVHCDIKPDNILITSSGHLKLADFGLINNTNFILRKQQRNLYHQRLIPDQVCDPVGGGGTARYFDMELCFTYLQKLFPKLHKKLISDNNFNKNKLFDVGKINKTYAMSFSSDLWAVGCVISELLFFGNQFWLEVNDPDDKSIPDGIARVILATSRLFYLSDLYEVLIVNGMIPFCQGAYKDIVDIILHIFRPRNSRLIKYTKEFMLMDWLYAHKGRIIDLEKIEQIKVFKDRNITQLSVLTYQFPENFIKLYDQPKLQGSTAMCWLQHLSSQYKVKDPKLFHFEPGCSVTWNR